MSRRELFALASLQHGYFRTAQALGVGWTRSGLNTAVNAGELEKVSYGLYRFAHYPTTPQDELHELQTLAPAGTFTRETALALFSLTDILPRTIHFAVPPASGFKPRAGVTVHHARIAPAERVLRDGLWVTTPARTLLDSAKAGVDPEQLLEAAREARDSGLLSGSDVAALRHHYPYTLIGAA
jgi:predicted transcriptional regulator of viral defense system